METMTRNSLFKVYPLINAIPILGQCSTNIALTFVLHCKSFDLFFHELNIGLKCFNSV